MRFGARAKGLGLALVANALASLWLASLESTNRILVHPPLGATALRVAGGPLTGWIEAVRMDAVPMALWGLLPATMFSIGPLVLWVTSGAWFWLVVATFVWISAGYFYAIAIWV